MIQVHALQQPRKNCRQRKCTRSCFILIYLKMYLVRTSGITLDYFPFSLVDLLWFDSDFLLYGDFLSHGIVSSLIWLFPFWCISEIFLNKTPGQVYGTWFWNKNYFCEILFSRLVVIPGTLRWWSLGFVLSCSYFPLSIAVRHQSGYIFQMSQNWKQHLFDK